LENSRKLIIEDEEIKEELDEMFQSIGRDEELKESKNDFLVIGDSNI
jgi:hypothetical protein